MATNFHAAGSGSGTNGRTRRAHTDEPATTDAVSSIGSPPGAALSSAFQDAWSNPAPRTASVMPRVSSCAGIMPGAMTWLCRFGLPLLPCRVLDTRIGADCRGCRLVLRLEPRTREDAGFLEDRIGDRADVRVDAPQIGDQVEVQRRRLDAVDGVPRQAAEVRVRVRALEVAEQDFLREQFLRVLEI